MLVIVGIVDIVGLSTPAEGTNNSRNVDVVGPFATSIVTNDDNVADLFAPVIVDLFVLLFVPPNNNTMLWLVVIRRVPMVLIHIIAMYDVLLYVVSK